MSEVLNKRSLAAKKGWETRRKRVSQLPKDGEILQLAGHDVQYLAVKDSAQMPAIIEAAMMFSGKTGIPDPENFEDYAEVYQDVVWVYSSAYAIANSLAKMPIKLWKDTTTSDGKTGRVEVTKHPILDLLWRPNSTDSWEDLVERVVIALELAGDGYIEIVKGNVGELAAPTELYYIRPDRIKIIPAKNGHGIGAYRFTANPAMPTQYEDFGPEEVAHIFYHNPLDDWYGQGSAKAATRAILLEQYQERFCQRFFEHDATPRGVLMTEQNITKDEASRILREWKAKYAGVDKAHKIAILPLGLEYQKIGSSLSEIGLESLDEGNRGKIMAAFGVNDAVLGITGKLPRDVYRTQIRHFYEHTLLPKAKKIANALTYSLVSLYENGENLYLEYDFHDVLAEPYDVRLGQWERRFAFGGATIKEIVEDLGGTPVDAEYATWRFVKSNYIPLHILEKYLLSGKSGEGSNFGKEEDTENLASKLNDIADRLEALETKVEEK